MWEWCCSSRCCVSKVLTLWIVKTGIMILLSLRFARNGYKRWGAVCHPDKTAVTLVLIMKDRPTRKCNLATDQVIHATHDPQKTHAFMGVLGSFWIWVLDLIIHEVALKRIRFWLPAESLSHQQYVPPSLGASEMIINLLRFARSPIHSNCLEHLMSLSKHDPWAANRAGPAQLNSSHIRVHCIVHWDQLKPGFFSSQAYTHCAATMVAAAFCGFARSEGME